MKSSFKHTTALLRVQFFSLLMIGSIAAMAQTISEVSSTTGTAFLDPESSVLVSFDAALSDPLEIDVRSKLFGVVAGSWADAGSNTWAFTPDQIFERSDMITVQHGVISKKFQVAGLNNSDLASTNFWTIDNTWSNDTTLLQSVVHGDFNGDGHIDVMGIWRGGNDDLNGKLKLALGSSDGTLGEFNELFSSLSKPQNIYATDLELDGDLDIVLGGYGGSERMHWLFNDGSGNFTSGGVISGNNWYFDFGDMDGDGDEDLLTTSTTRARIYRNDFNEGGSFTLASEMDEGLYYAYAPCAGDFDGDGDLDMVVSALGFSNGGYDEKWVWFEFTGDMTSGWISHVIESDAAGGMPNVTDFKAADMDGDGDLDLVAQTGSVMLLNDGSGNFTRTTWSTLDFSGFYIVDLDGDGDNDVLGSRFNNASYVMRNNGSGVFSTLALQMNHSGGAIIPADFNSDGFIDVFVNNRDDDFNGMGIYQLLGRWGSILNVQSPSADAVVVSAQAPSSSGLTERGVVLSANPGPTTADTVVTDPLTIAGEFDAPLPALEPGTTYYVRSYTVISGNTHYSPAYSFTTPIQLTYNVGDVGPAGGIVWLVDSLDVYPEFDYIEVAPVALQAMRPWGCQGHPTDLYGADAEAASIGTADMTAVGDGEAATGLIVAGCAETPNAAQYTDSLWVVENGAFFDDWFLPSRDEHTSFRDAIEPMTAIWDTIGIKVPLGQPSKSFWTSTEWFNTGQAMFWAGEYSNFTGAVGKAQSYSVLPMRAFSEEPGFGASEPAPMTAAALGDTAVCSGASTVTIDLSEHFLHPTGASMTYNVAGGPTGGEWSASISGNNLVMDFSGSGDDASAELTITATDDNSDSTDVMITVTEYAAIAISETLTHPSNLVAADGEIELTVDGGLPAAGTGPCAGEESVTYNGKVYGLVEIGDQCWFNENLQTTSFSDGTPLTLETSNAIYMSGLTDPIYANPQEGTAYVDTFGLYYSWAALGNTEKNLCPSGYHVPTSGDVMALRSTMIADFGADYGALADTASATWAENYAVNGPLLGWNMRSSGVRANVIWAYADGTIGWIGTSTKSTTAGKNVIGSLKLTASTTSLYTQSLNEKYGYPTRCIRDEGPDQSQYSPVWGGSETTASITGQTAGSFNVTVTDNAGCSASENFTLVALDLSPASDSLFSDTLCFGASDLTLGLDTLFVGDPDALPLTFSVAGGPDGDEFSASVSGNLLTVDFSADGGLGEVRDTLFITATDASSRATTIPWVLMERASLALDGTVTDVTSLGGSDGQIAATATGTSLSWSWDNSATTATITGISAGSYSVEVTDGATGCSASKTFTVDEPGQMELVGNWHVVAASSPNSSNGGIQGTFQDGSGLRTVTMLIDGEEVDFDFASGTNFSQSFPPGVYYIVGFSDAGGSETIYPTPLRLMIPNSSCD